MLPHSLYRLPILQCKQNFRSMDVGLKESVKEIISKEITKYRLLYYNLFITSIKFVVDI